MVKTHHVPNKIPAKLGLFPKDARATSEKLRGNETDAAGMKKYISI